MRVRLLITLVALALVATMAPAAQANHGRLHNWEGRVTYVADGDTFDVRIKGIGVKRVRMAAIQAMEHGQCHYTPAKRSLKKLIDGKLVRLRAYDPDSRAFEGGSRDPRLLRFVQKRVDGRWVDVGRIQMERGHVLWHPHPTENLYDLTYHREMLRAAKAGKNLWNTRKCGAGPNQAVTLKMWAQTDADSNDFKNLDGNDGEWIKIWNTSPAATVDLGGWRVRLAPRNMFYKFGAGTKLGPGKTMTVYVGKGDGDGSGPKRNWGRDKPLFRNVGESKEYVGDGIYLYDKHLDMRAWWTYPCALGCASDPLKGKVEIGNIVFAGDTESFDVRNVSGSDVNLYGYLAESWPYSYEFLSGTILPAGQTMTVYVGRGNDDPARGEYYWGAPMGLTQIFNNGGDQVRLRTFDYVTVHCQAFRDGRC